MAVSCKNIVHFNNRIVLSPAGCSSIAFGSSVVPSQRPPGRHGWLRAAQQDAAQSILIRTAQEADVEAMASISHACAPLGGAGWSKESIQARAGSQRICICGFAFIRGLDIHTNQGMVKALTRAQEELCRPTSLAAVAERDATVAGLAIAWLVAGELQILEVAVSPDCQRQGIGRRLVEWLLQQQDRSAAAFAIG